MAATTRPYICIYNGVTRMVDAKDPGAVVRHVVGAAVTELRPARAGEVAAWAREKKDIEIAGVSAAPAAVTADTGGWTPKDDEAPFTVDDMWAWLDDQVPGDQGAVVGSAYGSAMQAMHEAKSADQMTLFQFDTIRTAFPEFGEAIANHTGSTIDEARAMLEDTPMQFKYVVSAVRRHVRGISTPIKQQPDDPNGGGDKMVGDTGHIEA